MRMNHLSAMAAMAMVAGAGAVARDDLELRLLSMPDPFVTDIIIPRRTHDTHYRKPYEARSRYVPHIGAKERARHAGKPDGAMHVTGWQRQAEHAEWLRANA